MNKFHSRLFVLIGLALVGCQSPDAAFKDMSPTPTAILSDDWLTVHLGADTKNSSGWVRPNATLKDRTVYVNGYHTRQFTSRELSLPLSVPAQSEGLRVVWVNPDGSAVPVPLTQERVSGQGEKTDIATMALSTKSVKPVDHDE
jgi:hypothetical protein